MPFQILTCQLNAGNTILPEYSRLAASQDDPGSDPCLCIRNELRHNVGEASIRENEPGREEMQESMQRIQRLPSYRTNLSGSDSSMNHETVTLSEEAP